MVIFTSGLHSATLSYSNA